MSFRTTLSAAARACLTLSALLLTAGNAHAYGPNNTFDPADFILDGRLGDKDAQEAYRIIKALGIPETYNGSGSYTVFSFICGEAIFDFSLHPCIWKVGRSSQAVSQIPPKGSDLEKLHGLMIKAGGSYNGDDNPLAATYPAQVACHTQERDKPGRCSMEFDTGFRSVTIKTDASKATVANKLITMLSRLGVNNAATDGNSEAYTVDNIACFSESRVSNAVTCDPVIVDGIKQNGEYVQAINGALSSLGMSNARIRHSFFEKIALHCTRSAVGAMDASCEITYVGADVRAGKEF